MSAPAFGQDAPCRSCQGGGTVLVDDVGPYQKKRRRVECPECRGSGLVAGSVRDVANDDRRRVAPAPRAR